MCANPGRWNFWQQLRLRESRVTYSTASILSAHRLIVECFLATIPPLAVFTRAYRQNVLFLLRWSQKFTDWKIFLCAVCDVRSCLQLRYIMHIPLGDMMNVRLHVTYMYLPEKCCLRFGLKLYSLCCLVYCVCLWVCQQRAPPRRVGVFQDWPLTGGQTLPQSYGIKNLLLTGYVTWRY